MTTDEWYDGPPRDDAYRAAYESETRRSCLRGANTYCVLAAVMILATIPLDHVRFPALAARVLPIRFAGITALAAILGLLRSSYGRRHPFALGVLPPAAAGGLVQALAFATGGHASPVTVDTNFVIIGVALLMPWPPVWSTLACVAVLGDYVAASAWTHTLDDPHFAANLLGFTAASAAAIVTTAVRERWRQRDFRQRWILAATHSDARASAERYRSLVEIAGSVIVVLARDGRIMEFNREAVRVLGWPTGEAIGQDYLRLCVPASWRDMVGAGIRRALKGESVHGVEARMVTREGAERVFVSNVSPIGDGGAIVCAQDITERKRMEEALAASEARLRTVITGAPVVLFTLDRAGVCTVSEGRGLARLGLKPGQVVGRHFAEVLAAFVSDAERAAGYFRRALAGEKLTWLGASGEMIYECRLNPIVDADGRPSGVIGIATDVTERERAETARLALERKLLEAKRLESLGVLAGGVAHDFNNLLVNVLGNASLAAAELPDDSPVRESLRRIEAAARRGSELTRQMLAYAGKEPVSLQGVDVNAAVEDTIELLNVSIPVGVVVRPELAERLPEASGDPSQVRQVLMNLVINAAEAVGDAGTITVRTAAVQLDETGIRRMHRGSQVSAGPHVCLEVADSGGGIDPASMGKIFDPFFSTKFAGRGLGLATVLGIVRGHRGGLSVQSEPGRGTTFRIFLPCAEQPPSDVRPPAEPSTRTVLLVDDEEDVRAVTMHMLERLGCSVLVAGDGHEGVEVFRAHAPVIDAVLIDLTLPRLSGEGACREIRTIRSDARVILMSGYSEEVASGRLADAGAAAFLRKPFSVTDLRSTMDRALGPPPA